MMNPLLSRVQGTHIREDSNSSLEVKSIHLMLVLPDLGAFGLSSSLLPLHAWPTLPDWWHEAEDNVEVQAYVQLGLAAAYALVALVALVQLIRIQLRVPEYGWTTQKVFHLLNCLVCSLRAGVFFFHEDLETLPAIARVALLDAPGLLFFTTYTLLVLFWAEIYHQARSMPTGLLRPVFAVINIVVYLVLAGLWSLSMLSTDSALQQMYYVLSDVFLAGVSLCAALGFVLYGGRLFLMLQRFPIESRGRRKKLQEVGLVTSICAGCFTIRAILVGFSAVDRQDLELDVTGHPILNALYYSLTEIIPTACVLYILRKLPPKRAAPNQASAGQYQPIPSNP